MHHVPFVKQVDGETEVLQFVAQDHQLQIIHAAPIFEPTHLPLDNIQKEGKWL